ncbi:MAG: NAD(P)-dependent oxidoreductase [Actinobacteria bacterium]|nr:NAD(P)-dependent oxidoreductase [Actinomycetota bacterium]
MSTVLVTGAGGFVGSAIVRRLVSSDARFWDGAPVEHVVALLRPGGSDERLETLPRNGTSSIERADVHDRGALEAVLQAHRPRAVVHAVLDGSAYEADDQAVVRGPLETVLAGLSGEGRFLHVGSAWVLAPGEQLNESAPLAPFTPYALNKAREDRLLPELAQTAGVPWLNLRLFNLFGRYEKASRLVPTLVARLSRSEAVEVTHGAQIRDFNDVDVAARAFVDALAASPSACGAVYHIGSGRGTSVRELALGVAEIVGDPDLVRFGASGSADEHLPILVADPSLATAVLGWHPDLDLEARIADTAHWWLERLGRAEARGTRA